MRYGFNILILIFIFSCYESAFAQDVTITISGPDAPVTGGIYNASGGTAPYTWSISCGSITQNGIVNIPPTCCGSGTVTVTNDCGWTATKDVRMPSGKWVYDNYIWHCMCGSWSSRYYTTIISGDTRTVYSHACVSPWPYWDWINRRWAYECPQYCASPTQGNCVVPMADCSQPVGDIPPAHETYCASISPYAKIVNHLTYVYKWRCQ